MSPSVRVRALREGGATVNELAAALLAELRELADDSGPAVTLDLIRCGAALGHAAAICELYPLRDHEVPLVDLDEAGDICGARHRGYACELLAGHSGEHRAPTADGPDAAWPGLIQVTSGTCPGSEPREPEVLPGRRGR